MDAGNSAAHRLELVLAPGIDGGWSVLIVNVIRVACSSVPIDHVAVGPLSYVNPIDTCDRSVRRNGAVNHISHYSIGIAGNADADSRLIDSIAPEEVVISYINSGQLIDW
jgi:hypothetical protein